MKTDTAGLRILTKPRIHDPVGAIIDRAKSLLGTEYQHCGRDRRGIDCLGLFFYSHGIDERDYPEVSEARGILRAGYYQNRKWRFDRRNPDHMRSCEILNAALTKHLLSIRLNRIKPGDVLLMSFKNKAKGQGDHLAIYLGNDRIIHADFEEGVVEVDIGEKITWDRVVSAFRKGS